MITRTDPRLDALTDQLPALQRAVDSQRSTGAANPYLTQLVDLNRRIDAARSDPDSPAVAAEWAEGLRVAASVISDRGVAEKYRRAAEILES